MRHIRNISFDKVKKRRRQQYSEIKTKALNKSSEIYHKSRVINITKSAIHRAPTKQGKTIFSESNADKSNSGYKKATCDLALSKPSSN